MELADEDEDPFEILGHGILSYFRMIEVVICVFFICTILFLPTMYLYSKGDGFAVIGGSSYYLGNLGFAEPWCASMRIANSYSAECGAGEISELKFVGLRPAA